MKNIGLKILSILAGAILVATIFFCVLTMIDIISSFDPSSGHTLGNIGYIIVLMFGVIGSSVSGILSIIGLIVSIVKKERGFIIIFSVILGLVALLFIFVLAIGPDMLPKLS